MSTQLAPREDPETADEQTSQVIKLRDRSDAPAHGAPETEQASKPATTIRFIEGEDGCSMVEVETSERSGFIRGLSRALLQESVQIVRAEVKRVSGGVVDRFTIADHDGSPIRAAKRLALQVAVMAAVDLAS